MKDIANKTIHIPSETFSKLEAWLIRLEIRIHRIGVVEHVGELNLHIDLGYTARDANDKD